MVGGTLLEKKSEESPPQWAGLFGWWGGHLGGTGWDNPPHLETAYVHPYAGESSKLRSKKVATVSPASGGSPHIRVKNQQPCPPHVAGSPLRLSPQIFVGQSNCIH